MPRPGCILLWLAPGLGHPKLTKDLPGWQDQKYLLFNLSKTPHFYILRDPLHSWQVISGDQNCATQDPPGSTRQSERRSSGSQPQNGSARRWAKAYLYLSHFVIHSSLPPSNWHYLLFMHSSCIHSATICPFFYHAFIPYSKAACKDDGGGGGNNRN